MSYYPSGYGQWPDPAAYLPSPQPPQQSKKQPQSQQMPHAYTYPPSAPAASGPYPAALQAAFSYNATQIPGLGASGGATPSQYQSPWLPPQSYAGYNQPTPKSQHPPPQPFPISASNAPATPAQKPQNDDIEEEDFDDLYEPQPADNIPKVPAPSNTGTLLPSKKDAEDAQDEAFYGAEPGEVMSNQGGTPCRERSGSYSPYLSPREIDLEAGTSQDTSDAEAGRAQPVSRPELGPQSANQASNGIHVVKDSTGAGPAPGAPSDPSSIPAPAFKSADEAKKEAQKSILRLLPLGVKLQNYIDEGLDESIVKSLFGDLNLLPPSAPAKSAAESAQKKEPAVSEPSSTVPAKAKDQGEERKDRIARLLAAKAAKSTAAAPSLAPAPKPAAPTAPAAMSRQPPPTAPKGPAALQNLPPPSAPTGPAAMQKLPPPSAPTGPAALRKEVGSSPASKVKSKADKELLLKKKMEALLQSRQAQAKQAAAASKTPASAAGKLARDTAKEPSLPLPPKPPVSVPQLAPEISAASGAPPVRNPASPSPASSRAGSTIPGLYLSASTGSAQPSRKRPVAADFVDYNTSVPKRPFGQNRQDSFVIDISEDEESDDDVEMEVDSPAAGSPSSSNHQVDTPGRKGPSIKDFPPLSDGPHKRPLSRTSSSGPRPAKLHQLNGEITSLQKRIAELEARKAKRSGSGAQTPDIAVETPTEFLESVNALVAEPKENGVRPPTAPQRAVSSSEVDGTDLASAQLISEAASAGLPRRLGHPKNTGKTRNYGELSQESTSWPTPPPMRPELLSTRTVSHSDRRIRIASVQLPKIEATLLEKKTKLKLLEQKTNQLRLEIEREAAEKEKLAEELRQLEHVELGQEDALARGSDPNAPMVMAPASKALPSQDTTEPSSTNSVIEPAKDSEQAGDEPGGTMSSPDDDAAGAEPMILDDEDVPTPDSASGAQGKAEPVVSRLGQTTAESSSSHETAAVDAVASTPATKDNASPKATSQPTTTDDKTASAASTPESGEIEDSELEEASDAGNQSPAQPNVDEFQQEDDYGAEAGEVEDRSSPVPVIVSDTRQSSRNEAEAARKTGNGEGPSRAGAVQLTSFTPYESPLKYFRSYRFHPEYASNVRGGLKSLTYTNKIDPNQELCPNELIKQQCDDKACRFQHFVSMKPKDDYILIELGRADEFAEGEEKNKFIAGLRDLLMAYRTQKVRDYDKIGYGIIEYRRKFIGDDSRVLNGLHDTKI